MKKCLLIIIVVCLAACQKDFDEVEDTNQRHIDFLIDTGNLLSDVLFSQSNTFWLGVTDSITSAHRVRVSAYCYDATGNLVASQHHIVPSLGQTTITFRHLLKQTSYHFVFLADVVRTDEHLDYQETWYQLATKHRNTAYLFSNEMSKSVVENILKHAATDVEPSNQAVSVTLQPATYNGYIVLTHTDDVFKLNGTYGYSASLSTEGLTTRKSATSSFVSFYSNGTDALWPVTLTKNDTTLQFSLDVSTSTNGLQSLTEEVSIDQRRPFVVFFDCSSLSITDVKYY